MIIVMSFVFEKLHYQNVLRPHLHAKPAFSNSSGLRSAFESFFFVTDKFGR